MMTSTNTASEKQISFIESLKSQRDVSGPEAQTAISVMNQMIEMGEFSTKVASSVIDVLKAAPWPAREQVATSTAPEGIHYLNGQVFKVQIAVHGSGKPYAKVLEGTSWSYTPGAIRNLSEATLMTLEQAREYGHLYGVCCNCGATLTDEKSIAAGVGPVCAKKFGA